MQQRDTDWFRPLWRRVTVTAFVTVWLAWETWTGVVQRPENPDYTWVGLVGFVFIYAIWSFFIAFDKRGKKPDDTGTPPPAA